MLSPFKTKGTSTIFAVKKLANNTVKPILEEAILKEPDSKPKKNLFTIIRWAEDHPIDTSIAPDNLLWGRLHKGHKSLSMSNTKTVDSSLWFDSFASILTDLENSSLSSDLPPHLAKKLKENHAWFVETASLFKKPNAKSREALNSAEIKIGYHEIPVKPELKDKALRISSYLCLDEVQSYILVERSLERDDLAVDFMVEDYLHVVLLQYYIERQCLLKCTRRILMHACKSHHA
ncbi:unnamed protein product [Dovyalis caffra]|uniref:Nucleoporin Nup188 N-terminal domain-containing protein n=1 Tax=Dovyalis caffra TaxID=77055 RepID=A0AAV1R7W0_9ROSI|nr:unnamed protein product [Dovyalis caffra]